MRIVDTKAFHGALFSKQNTTDKSVCPDARALKFFVETNMDRFVWIFVLLNSADVNAKKDSPLTKALVLTIATAYIQLVSQDC